MTKDESLAKGLRERAQTIETTDLKSALLMRQAANKIAAIGGEAEPVAWRGWKPEWSPDDTQVVFEDDTGRVWHPHRGYWAYKTAHALSRAETRIAALESTLLSDDDRGFLFALLGADTWMEAGAIWDGNPVQRKSAHTILARQGGVK